MMKVLHVVPTYLPATRYGGPIYSVHGLCVALVKAGVEVHVATTSVDGDDNSDVPLGTPVLVDGVHVWYFPSNLLRRLYYSPAMKRFFNEKMTEFNLVHLHSVYLWPTNCAARIAYRCKVPYLIAPRGMLVNELIRQQNYVIKSLWLRLIERRTLRDASVFHATSKREYHDAKQVFRSLPPALTIPNGIELKSKNAYTTQNKSPYIMYLGRINWKKGLERLLAAISELTNVRLLIVGNDEENYIPKLKKQICALGLEQVVEFTGPKYADEKYQLLHDASALVLPSMSENFGNVIIEAWNVACPVICSPEVGLSDDVRTHKAGFVFSTDAELIRAIRRMLDDLHARNSMGRNGYELVKRSFGWPHIADQMMTAYQQILDQRGRLCQ